MATFQGMQVVEVRLSGLIALTRTHQLEFVRIQGAIVKLLSARFRPTSFVKPTGGNATGGADFAHKSEHYSAAAMCFLFLGVFLH